MDWKILAICAFVGGFAAGPFGVIIGTGVGFVVSLMMLPQNPADPKDAPFLPYITAFAAAASINGQASEKGARRAKVIAQRIEGIGDQQNIERLFAIAQQTRKTPEQCGEMFRIFDGDAQIAFAVDLFSIIYAESPSIDPAKADWLFKVAQTSGLPSEFWGRITAYYEPGEVNTNPEPALQALELNTGATETEIKIRYRELCLEYHPDRHANVSPGLKRLAEEKLKEINAAFEALGSRGTPPLSMFRVRAKDGAWFPANSIESTFVSYCILCGQANRIEAEKILLSRCGTCFAQLAVHRDLADAGA